MIRVWGIAVGLVAVVVLVAAADVSDADLRAQLGQARSWLVQNPPDGTNATARRARMAVLQTAGDRLSDLDYRDYARSWETNKPLADLLETRHPVLGYLRDVTAEALDEIRRTRVREGLAVWFIYNMGYVFKTPHACFGIDVEGRGVERLAPDLDFLLNTHEHGDHVHEPLFRAMLALNKPVVTRWYPGSLLVSQGTNLVFGEVGVRIDIGDHHREQPRQRDNMLMFEVDCGPSANHAIIYHSGDGDNIEKLRPAKPVDIFILHTSVGLSVPDAIYRVKPTITFVSHVMELGHSPLPPHAWRWPYDYAFGVIRDIPEREATVLTWGERWLAPGASLQSASAE
ncbi:MAG TPA: MBL fold metallo-hydrolase [Kiritimatiellia bacterium]|nr:MBL fold metallo-hydrolase [Kiritimatiellia bacterium]HPS07602.1 MBL fold metallo-hydrolase [Kiritimatiellia bacterium]